MNECPAWDVVGRRFGALQESALDKALDGGRLATPTRVRPESTGRAVGRRRGSACLAAMGAGIGTMTLATALAVSPPAAHHKAVDSAPSVGNPVPAFPQVGTARLTYAAGHTSGWHVHPGVHSVVVLAGTLTIYDESCRRQEYGPGEMYLGGASPHLARNETAEPLDLAVTSVFAITSVTGPGTPTPPPTGCDVS